MAELEEFLRRHKELEEFSTSGRSVSDTFHNVVLHNAQKVTKCDTIHTHINNNNNNDLFIDTQDQEERSHQETRTVTDFLVRYIQYEQYYPIVLVCL